MPPARGPPRRRPLTFPRIPPYSRPGPHQTTRQGTQGLGQIRRSPASTSSWEQRGDFPAADRARTTSWTRHGRAAVRARHPNKHRCTSTYPTSTKEARADEVYAGANNDAPRVAHSRGSQARRAGGRLPVRAEMTRTTGARFKPTPGSSRSATQPVRRGARRLPQRKTYRAPRGPVKLLRARPGVQFVPIFVALQRPRRQVTNIVCSTHGRPEFSGTLDHVERTPLERHRRRGRETRSSNDGHLDR